MPEGEDSVGQRGARLIERQPAAPLSLACLQDRSRLPARALQAPDAFGEAGNRFDNYDRLGDHSLALVHFRSDHVAPPQLAASLGSIISKML
jgi:hypothetical protein